jgi:methyl-accepting chemotaxis protein
MFKFKRKSKGFSLTFRLSLGITLLISCLMAVTGVTTYIGNRNAFMENAINRSRTIERTVNTFSVHHMREKDYMPLFEMIHDLENDGFIKQATVMDTKGKIVAHTGGQTVGQQVTYRQVADTINTNNRCMLPINDDSGKVIALSFTSPITDSDGFVYGYFHLIVDFTFVQEHLRNTGYNMLAIFVIASLAGLALTRLIILKAVHRPVQELLGMTEKVSVGDFSGKVNVTTSDELGQLARGFNVMNGHLGKLFGAIRSTVDEMSQTSTFIAKQSEDQDPGFDDKAIEDRRRQVLKEINGSAKRLARLSQKLDSLAMQFRTEP